MSQLDLQKLKRMVENASDLTEEAREAAERDRDYYDDHQWTAEEIEILRRRRQPVITVNRIKRKVDAMIGLEQRMRVDPKAMPRTPQDEPAAEAATKGLVFVDDNTRFDSKRSQAFENMIVEGYGGVEVIVKPKRDQLEVTINRLRWEEIFFDPHSREKDFSDANYIGTQKWMALDEAVSSLSGAWQGDPEELTELLQTAMTNTQTGETYDDRPLRNNAFRWADKRQRRVRVAQMYYKSRGQWYLAIFVGGGEIFNDVSPYMDEDGQPTCPIELMTAYIDRENRRYGAVRSMISQQDEINKRRSKLLHMLNSRQSYGVKGAVPDESKLKRELSDPQGHVSIDLDAFEEAARMGVRPFDILPNNDQIAGQFQLLQEGKGEIDMFGPNPSLIGQTENGASGRAIMAQQQAGMAELAPLYDSLRDWTIRVYRAMWARMKQFWREPRWVRITDSATNQTEWLAFNQPTGAVPVMTPQGPMLQPQFQNVPAEMDLDLIIEDVPDHVTLQAEQFEQLTQMASNGIPIPPEMIIKASNIPDKGEVLEAMGQAQQAAAQQAMQEREKAFQLEAIQGQAKAARDGAEAQKTQVEAVQMAQGLR